MSNAQPELRDWLRAIMKERNMTHRELADLCGFGKATITNIVSYTSKVEAGPDTCRALAQGLGVPEHEVLEVAGWIGRMEPHDADLRLIQHAYFIFHF